MAEMTENQTDNRVTVTLDRTQLELVEGDITATNRRRLLGYQEALLSAGITPDPALVLTTDGFGVAAAESAVAAALGRGLDFDAVLCRDDRFGVGALAAVSSGV